MNYFFVTGNPKSGTTWMQLLIDAHPQATCSGEGHFMELFLDPLIRMKEGYNQRLRLGVERVFQGKRYYADLTNQTVATMTRQFVLNAISQRAGPETLAVGDKTPRHNLRLGDLHAIFPEARLINIVRHPYDVAVSRLHHARRAGMPEALEQGSKAHVDHVTNAAKAWIGGQASVARFQTRHPGVLLELRYEDMLEDPHTGAAAIFRHIGVSDEAGLVAAAVKASDFETQSGRKRGEAHETSFFRKGVAGDWQGTLDAAAIAVLNEICGEAFEKLGYAAAHA